jgi:hypothetical protein
MQPTTQFGRLALSAVSGQAAHQRRGAADCGQHRQAAGAIAEAVKQQSRQPMFKTGQRLDTWFMSDDAA